LRLRSAARCHALKLGSRRLLCGRSLVYAEETTKSFGDERQRGTGSSTDDGSRKTTQLGTGNRTTSQLL
jgi:hypothetical protein